jgi:hypothetical protein
MTKFLKTLFIMMLIVTNSKASDFPGKGQDKETEHIMRAAHYSALKVTYLQLRNDYVSTARKEACCIRKNLEMVTGLLNTLQSKGPYCRGEYREAEKQIAIFEAGYQDARVKMQFHNLALVNQLQAEIKFHWRELASVKSAKAKKDHFNDHRQQIVARYYHLIDPKKTDFPQESLLKVQNYLDKIHTKFNNYFNFYMKRFVTITTLRELEDSARRAFTLYKASECKQSLSPNQLLMTKRKRSKSFSNSPL